MNRRTFTVALSALIFSATAVFAQTATYTIDTNHAQTDFKIQHMEVSEVRGSIGGVTGTIVWNPTDPSKSSVNATIDTRTVNTTNSVRDKDLKSDHFFNVEKYPTMTFKSTSIQRMDGKLQVTGDLTLTGVTKSVTLDVDGPVGPKKGMGGKTVIGISASGTVKRSDFNFGAKYPAAMIGNDVEITIDAEADR